MSPRHLEVWGTFDVANLGDLLYPLVLEHELRSRGCDADLHLASPYGGAVPMGDGRPVRRITTADEPGFAKQADVDGIVFGGGDLFGIRTYPAADLIPGGSGPYRFDPFVGELTLLADSTPVVWNGVGVPIPFAEPAAAVVRLAAARVPRFVSVRDEPSRELLIAAGVDREISVVPDPTLVVDRLWTRAELAAAVERLRARNAYPTSGPILAFHVSFTDLAQETELADRLGVLLDRDRALRIALLPIGLCHGDGARVQRLADALGPRACAAADAVTIIELVAAIAQADAFIGSSLHGNLIAARFGVPHAFLMLPTHRPHKLIAASAQLGRAPWNIADGLGILSIAPLLLDGHAPVDAARIDALAARVDRHYDDVVAALSGGGRRSRCDFLVDLEPARVTAAAGAVATMKLPGLRGPAGRLVVGDHRDDPGSILRIARLRAAALHDAPYRWGVVRELFDVEDQRALFEEFPSEPFVTIAGDDGEKGYAYEARNLVAMGGLAPWRPDRLSEPWFRFATDLCSPAYRDALSALTGVALDELVMEANLFHYAPRAWLGPHVDLREKVVTHVLYFNLEWDARDGGCLRVLASRDDEDVAAEVLPLAGSSVVLVRSDSSWHAVTPVVTSCGQARRSVTVTFYPAGDDEHDVAVLNEPVPFRSVGVLAFGVRVAS